MLLRLPSSQHTLVAARSLAARISSARRASSSRRRAMGTSTSASLPVATASNPYGLVTLSGATLESTLRRLGPPSSIQIVPHDPSSPFVRPASVLYQLDGKTRRWDIVASHASVGIVTHHTGLNAFLLVRQFRPAVYAAKLRDAQAAGKPPPELVEAFTYELCAGIVDKPEASLEEIAAEEVAEECGFHVAPSALRRIASAVSASGTSGTDHVMYFAQVDESMRAGSGGGVVESGEAIEVLALPFDATPAFVVDDSLPKSPGLMFGLLWAWQALRPGGQLAVAAARGAGARGLGGLEGESVANDAVEGTAGQMPPATQQCSDAGADHTGKGMAAGASAGNDAGSIGSRDAGGSDGRGGSGAGAPPTASLETQGLLLRPVGAECDEPLILRPVLPT